MVQYYRVTLNIMCLVFYYQEIGLCTSKATKLSSAVGLKNQCHLGASYWCASRANAVKCNVSTVPGTGCSNSASDSR